MSNNNNNTNIADEKRSLLKRMYSAANMYIKRYPTQTMQALYDKFKQTRSFVQRKTYLRYMLKEWCTMDIGVPPTEDEIDESKRLAECVFAYYRRQFNDEINADNCILLHEALEFAALINDGAEFDEKRYVTLITALTQAGKTFVMMAIANIHLALGQTPMFIVKDIKQKNQLWSRYTFDIVQLRHWLKTDKKFQDDAIEIFDDPLYTDSNDSSSKRAIFTDHLQSALNGSRRRSILSIWEVGHINRVKNLITSNSNLVIFIDEAHILGGYKKISESGEGHDLHDTKVKYDVALAELKLYAKKIFLITATPQDILMSEPHLYAYGVMWLPEGKSYRGIKDWEFNIFEDKKDDVEIEAKMVGSDGKDTTISIPQSFFTVMAELSEKNPMRRKNKFGVRDRHPINVLARFERINERQRMILECLKTGTKAINPEHQKIIDARWVVMTFNQYGVKLFHESLRGETITIGDETVKDLGTGEFLFPKAQIGEVWHWLWANGGVKRFPHMLTIAYQSAEEGITFCSTWSDDPTTDANWHLTDGYMRLGSSTSASKGEQSGGRGSGNHGDKFDKGESMFTCHCSMADKKKILKGYNLHYEQVQAICKLARDKDDCRVVDYIRELPVFSNQVPPKYYSIPKAGTLLTKRKNPDKDIEEESFQHHKSAKSTLQMLSPERYDGEARRERAKERVRGDENSGSDDDEKDGKYQLINSDILKAINHVTIYERLEKYLGDRQRTGKWMNRSELLNTFVSTYNYKYHTLAKDLTVFQNKKSTSTNNEKIPGILFKQGGKNGQIMLRLNDRL